jgi:hypothetical protein
VAFFSFRKYFYDKRKSGIRNFCFAILRNIFTTPLILIISLIPVMKKYLLYLLTSIIFLPGCYLRQAYYVSPFNSNNDHYHSMPLKSDSAKSATYFGASIYTGNANTQGADEVFAFQTNVSRAHQFGVFQAYYGADLTLGNYNVASFDSVGNSSTVNYGIINSMSGGKFFGAEGLAGGINVVLPGRDGSEWRALGVEGSSHHEFGDYLAFRNNLPDAAATLIIRNNFFTTLGIYTEAMFKINHGSVGIKLASGTVMESAYRNTNVYDNVNDNRELSYGYTNMTFSYTYNKWTGYVQADFGTKASGGNFGFNYHIGK